MSWYKQAKFLNNVSAFCGYCRTNLFAQSVSLNPNHYYPIGTDFICTCGKSKVWTNSIRDEQALLSFFKGLPGPTNKTFYYQGFCNDKICGYCKRPLDTLENGATIPGHYQRYDRLGSDILPMLKQRGFLG